LITDNASEKATEPISKPVGVDDVSRFSVTEASLNL
jgi:hypothetical protein